jgi:hypothetical protein
MPERLARDIEEAFEAKNVVRLDNARESRPELRRIANRPKADNEALEIVMVMRAREIMLRGTGVEIVLRCSREPQQYRGRDPAESGGDGFGRGAQPRPQFAP